MKPLRKASFRGVPFHFIDDSSTEHGRRVVLHEYPFRDIPYSEDLGRAARPFYLIATFLDKEEALRFIALTEEEGAGVLIHPWYGSHLVALKGLAKVNWPKNNGGRITIELNFIEAGENTEPDAAVDDIFNLNAIADELQSILDAQFGETWQKFLAVMDDVDAVVDSVSGVYSKFEEFLSPWERAISRIERAFVAVMSFIYSPAKLVDSIKDMIGRLGSLVDFSSSFSDVPSGNWKPLVDGSFFSEPPKVSWVQGDDGVISIQPSFPNSNNPLEELPSELKNYVDLSLLIEVSRHVPEMSFSNTEELNNSRLTLVEAYKPHLFTANDGTFALIKDLLQQVTQSIDQKVVNIDLVETVSTQAIMPVLLIDYNVSGQIVHDQDIIKRNNVKHPLFVAAGEVQVSHG